MSAPYEPYLEEILLHEHELQKRVTELGQAITRDYQGKDRLILICILKGGVMFLTDLMRHIDVPHEIDFLAVSAYGKGVRDSSGNVRIVMDLTEQVEGKHLLIVEDIIDTGHTLKFVMSMLRSRNPLSVRLCTMLDKPSRREVDIKVDYTGFEIPNKFVFGYGLDLDGRFRNLPFVGVVKPGVVFHG